MEISEFIDTYSDDLIYLHEARRALLTHPLGEHYAFSHLLDASFCRVTAVFVVGAIDVMLAEWRDAQRDRGGILDQWFGKKEKNSDRVRNLYQAFRDAGISVDQDVFNDYLAIKYLRNTIVHGRWHEHEKEWVEQRGFPTDTRRLNTEHLYKIDHTIQNMMLYISLTGIMGDQSSAATISLRSGQQKLIRLDENATRRVDDRGILKIQDLDRIIWNNVEKISSLLWHAIEKVASAGPYEWWAGRELKEIETLAHEDRKRLLFLAARRAGEDDCELLAQHRELAREALAFWREYWRRTASGIQEQEVGSALRDILQPPNGKVSERALQLGRCAYDVVPNIAPVTLLTLYLPITDPRNTAKYIAESDRVRPLFRLARAWYCHVERGVAASDEGLGFYDQMADEFRRDSSNPHERSVLENRAPGGGSKK